MVVPGDSDSKESAFSVGKPGSIGNVPWRREWLPTPVFQPGEFHGHGSHGGHREQNAAEG